MVFRFEAALANDSWLWRPLQVDFGSGLRQPIDTGRIAGHLHLARNGVQTAFEDGNGDLLETASANLSNHRTLSRDCVGYGIRARQL